MCLCNGCSGEGLPKGLNSPGSLVMSCVPFHPSLTPFASVHHPDYPGCLPKGGSEETPLDKAFLSVPRHLQPVGRTGHCLAFKQEPKVYHWYVTSEESGLRTGRFSFPPAVSCALPGNSRAWVMMMGVGWGLTCPLAWWGKGYRTEWRQKEGCRPVVKN